MQRQGIKALWQRILHNDAMHRRVDVELLDGLEQRFLIATVCHHHVTMLDTGCRAGRRLVAQIERPPVISAHRNRCQARLQTPFNQGLHLGSQRRTATVGNGFAINHACRHARTVDAPGTGSTVRRGRR